MSRIRWYSLSVSVSAGATVIESPVCTPIASTFSIEQMTTKLSATSRITSSSNSFQPMTDSSTRISCTGLRSIPRPGELPELLDVVRDAAANAAERERWPDDRRKAHVVDDEPDASSSVVATPLFGTSTPISCIALRNSSRSSATLMASICAPISLTLCRSSVPRSCSATARLSAVWPPTVGRTASGRLLDDDRLDHLGRQRLDVGGVGKLRVRHDRGRVAVDQDHFEPFGAQRLARLCARVVEFSRLADDDRARADHEDAFDVGALGHSSTLRGVIQNQEAKGNVNTAHRFSIDSRNCRKR